MPRTKTKLDRETLVAAIREAGKGCPEGRSLGREEFIRSSKIKHDDIYLLFPTWKEALAAAGMEWMHPKQGVPLPELLAEWGGVVRKFGHVPTQREYDRLVGCRRAHALTRRCGMWSRLPEDFREFAEGKEEWNDVVALLPTGKVQRHGRVTKGLRVGKVPAPDRRVYGAPLNFKNQRHAPVNEMGVVCLFGAISEELGFTVESVHGAFPDCMVKRDMGKEGWQVRRVEFEYLSRNFRDHGHPTDGCDIIVCWEHNWPECPAGIEVIALREEIKRMKDEGGGRRAEGGGRRAEGGGRRAEGGGRRAEGGGRRGNYFG